MGDVSFSLGAMEDGEVGDGRVEAGEVFFQQGGELVEVGAFAYRGVGYLVDGGGVQVFRFEVSGSRFQVQGFRFEVSGSRFQVRGFRFKVRGSRFEVRGSRLGFAEYTSLILQHL